jgi:hypothetical protein
MKIHQGIRNAVLAAILCAYGTSASAQVVNEVEPNHPIGSPQKLTVTGDPIGGKGSVTVNGRIDSVRATVRNADGTFSDFVDVDFYSFYGRQGDTVTIDIDGGIKTAGAGPSVDTILTLFRPGADFVVKDWINDLPSGPTAVDTGSISRFDARLDNVTLDATGIWIVGVTAYPARLVSGGTINILDKAPRAVGGSSIGAYTLIISGVSLPVMQISIDVKPGSGETAPINPKSKGTISVAVLGSAEFKVIDVNLESLTFGATGDEKSLRKCIPADRDVNGDGHLDLVCHFGTELMNVDEEHVRAKLKGMTKDGTAFEGYGNLKVVPVKKNEE